MVRFASGLATSRAASMKSCAAGLSARFLTVRIPIGPLTIGSLIGNFLMGAAAASVDSEGVLFDEVRQAYAGPVVMAHDLDIY